MYRKNRKLSMALIAIFWIIITYALIFDFNDLSDNRFFIPGMIFWLAAPALIYIEYKRK